jgi:molecular chaperone DnaK
MVHTAEKSLKDAGDKISAELRKEIEDAVNDVKTARGGDNLETIKKSSETLSDKMMKIGEAMKTANDNAAQEANNANKQADSSDTTQS